MDADTLAGRLVEPSGWVAILNGMFREGRAVRSHAVYSAARYRGVYDNHELTFTTHESIGYAIMAFTTTGSLDPALRRTLAARAGRFPPGAVRYAARTYNSLLPWARRARSGERGADAIEAIGDPYPGVFVYVAVTSTKGSNRPLVVHADLDGDDYLYPVPGDRPHGQEPAE